MRKIILVAFAFVSLQVAAQSKASQRIHEILEIQARSWNEGNIEGFMEHYWKSDSLVFIGKSGVTRGWNQTLENYKTGYPDAEAMGKLEFDILKIEKLTRKHYFVIGKWMLDRKAGDLSGHFSLIFKKVDGRWVIVSDHSS